MNDALRVDTDELRMTADQLDMHAGDLRRDHSAANTKLASTVSGFGASLSATALNERIAEWENETSEHHAELIRHSVGHRTACMQYASTDFDNSSQITNSRREFNEAASEVIL